MKVHILTFAAAKQAVGAERVTLELSDGATVGDALDALAAQHGSLAPLRDRLAAAVDMAYVPMDHVLSDGDEVALIPPVSGG